MLTTITESRKELDFLPGTTSTLVKDYYNYGPIEIFRELKVIDGWVTINGDEIPNGKAISIGPVDFQMCVQSPTATIEVCR